MPSRLIASVLFVLASLAAVAVALGPPDRLSPYSGVRWTDGLAPDVRLGERWVRLVAMEGVPADSLARLAAEREGRDWQELIAEDPADLLALLGWEPGALVRLRIADGAGVRDTTVEATEGARWRAWRFYNVDRWAERAAPRPTPVTPEDAARSPFTARLDGATPPADVRWAGNPIDIVADPLGHRDYEWEIDEDGWDGVWLRPAQADADLAALEAFLAEQFSYYPRRADAFLATVDTIRAGLGDGISRRDFAFQVRHAVAQFGDGHTRLSLSRNQLDLPGGRLPFVPHEAVGPDGEPLLLAVAYDHEAFLDPAHPVLTHVEGEPVATWLAAAEALDPGTAPQRARRDAARLLSAIDYLARRRRQPAGDSVRVRLASADGRSAVEHTVGLLFEPPRRPARLDLDDLDWWRVREGDASVGVIAVRDMDRDGDFLDGLREAMAAFRDTDGLVIDVRGNGGGSRDALRTLLPYLLDAPRVVNAARLRLDPAIDPKPAAGTLGERFMRPLGSERWTPAERRAVDAWTRGFEPAWAAPDSLFGRWHAMVVSPDAAPFRYRAPVVVLMDGATFSATDVFLGAFKGVPGVTLIGTASGGGSGYARDVWLGESGLTVQASSMASYLPTGALYETAGVAPDVVRPMTVADWRAWLAGGDPLLDAAVARLAG